MAFRCDSCGKTFSSAPEVSVTGRELCKDCSGSITAAGAGFAAGGTVGDAIATEGWWRRVRRARRKD